MVKMRQPFLVFVTAISLIAQAANENKAVFQDMCRILRLTLSTPEILKLPDNIDVKEEAKRILNTIQMLNFSSADPLLYDYIMKTDKLGDAKEAEDVTKGLSDSDWTFLKANFGQMKGGGQSSLAQKFSRPLSESTRRRVHKRVGLVLKKATELYEKLSTDGLNVEAAVLKARKSLVTAAYGGKVAEAVTGGQGTKTGGGEDKAIQAAETSFYQNTPSSAGCSGGTSVNPGLSIAADILCLCDKAVGGINNGEVCGLSGGWSHTTPWTDAGSGLNAWNQLASKCTGANPGEETPVPMPENLAEALAKFHGLLGTGGEKFDVSGFASSAGAVGRSHILGYFVTYRANGPTCDGSDTVSSASHGICVNYNKIIEGGGEIEWVKNVKKAMKHLRTARDLFSHQKDILTKMEMLEQTALQIYEDSIEEPGTATNDIKVNAAEKGATPHQDSQTVTVPSQKEGSESLNAHIGKLANMITIAVVPML